MSNELGKSRPEISSLVASLCLTISLLTESEDPNLDDILAESSSDDDNNDDEPPSPLPQEEKKKNSELP